ncbi:MAG: hypothetical protein GTO63_01405, partial [Anaerolineae bacterium]|nr:hypothetical protein [Anaerolineae bacterium]
EWIDLGGDQTAHVAAMQAGQIDNIYDPRAETFLALRDDPNVNVAPVASAATRVLRFRVDLEPWTDNRVRSAVKMLQNRQKIMDQAYFGEG